MMNNIVIERYPDKLVFVNPGTMLISVEQFFAGGTSICRNFGLQKMFSLKEPAVGLIPSPRDGKRTQTAGDVYLPKANTEGGAAGYNRGRAPRHACTQASISIKPLQTYT